MLSYTHAIFHGLQEHLCELLHNLPAGIDLCYVLGLMQGAFFIFHLLTKPFPSRDQPPIHLDHMTNHLTSHLTTHMISHMPFQSPAPQSHLSYITCSQVTCASPDTPSPDLT